MEAYITSLSCISHHPTFDPDFFFEGTASVPASDFLSITAPDYKNYIPAAALRRTSHLLKMGISAGLMCLKDPGDQPPDAIITGTAIGCYEDTDKFLRSIDENGERLLTPTSFIQSTHNTVAGQLAQLVKCHGYNFTYVQQALSFEYALLDALMLLKEGEAQRVLVGGMDELNAPLRELFERAGHIRNAVSLRQPLWSSQGKGFVAGEGAAFFLLSNQRCEKTAARISGVKALQNVQNSSQLSEQYTLFLEACGIKKEEVSLLLCGADGDAERDKELNGFAASSGSPLAYFKHLCGEYFTASAFATWFAARMLSEQRVPSCALPGTEAPKALDHIVIVNHHSGGQYALICISKC